MLTPRDDCSAAREGNADLPGSRSERSGCELDPVPMFGRLSTHYLCMSSCVKPRNSDTTWLLPALNPLLSQVVKNQLGLRIADRSNKTVGEELRRA